MVLQSSATTARPLHVAPEPPVPKNTMEVFKARLEGVWSKGFWSRGGCHPPWHGAGMR